MTAKGTALAHELIEAELSRIPEADRGKVADQVLGALTGRFMLIPHPILVDECATTREGLAALVPGIWNRS